MIVQGVSGDEGALGYFGLSYYEQNKDKLKAVAIDDGNGCVEPSIDTAQDGTYTPLSRPLFMYANAEALTRPEVKAFLQYVLDNEREIAQQAQFVPLTDEQLQQAKDALGYTGGRPRRDGASPPPLQPHSLRRARDQGAARPLRAHLRPDDRRDHRRALHPGVRVLPGGVDRRLPDGDGVGAALRARAVRRRPARRRDAVGDVLGGAGRDSPRARVGDLPQRVRRARACAAS